MRFQRLALSCVVLCICGLASAAPTLEDSLQPSIGAREIIDLDMDRIYTREEVEQLKAGIPVPRRSPNPEALARRALEARQATATKSVTVYTNWNCPEGGAVGSVIGWTGSLVDLTVNYRGDSVINSFDFGAWPVVRYRRNSIANTAYGSFCKTYTAKLMACTYSIIQPFYAYADLRTAPYSLSYSWSTFDNTRGARMTENCVDIASLSLGHCPVTSTIASCTVTSWSSS